MSTVFYERTDNPDPTRGASFARLTGAVFSILAGVGKTRGSEIQSSKRAEQILMRQRHREEARRRADRLLGLRPPGPGL